MLFKDTHKQLHPIDIFQITDNINTVDLPTAPADVQKATPIPTITFIVENLPRRTAKNQWDDIADMKANKYEQNKVAWNAVIQASQDLLTCS